MNTPSFKFKKMICAHNKDDREIILRPIKDWLMQQIAVDPKASACYASIQEAYMVNTWADNKAFKEHYLWNMMSNHDSCISFQEIVKAKGVPIKNIEVAIKDAKLEPRNAIPKKIRGEAWKIQFGDSTRGDCFCCKKQLDIFDDWHAGHIIAHSNGGADTADNLRPICGSCNLSMGTENMDAFKARCYPK
jgi:hypothetical protein